MNESNRRTNLNVPGQFNRPLVTKEEWIDAGLFILLAPQLCDMLDVSMQYVASCRMKYRGDPDFPVGAPYSVHAVKRHSIEEYLAAGLFDKPAHQVAREMGVGPDAVAAARAKIRRNPPSGIDPETIRYKLHGPRVAVQKIYTVKPKVQEASGPHGTNAPKKRGRKPEIVDREVLLRALLTCYNWKQVQEKLKISREVFLRSVKQHGFEEDAKNIKQAYRD